MNEGSKAWDWAHEVRTRGVLWDILQMLLQHRLIRTNANASQLPTLPAASTDKAMRRDLSLRARAQVEAQGTYLLSKCWLTVSSLVPSSGLMSFQGVGLSLVQTTAHPPHRQASCPSEALGKTYQQDRAQDATSTTYHPLRRHQQ